MKLEMLEIEQKRRRISESIHKQKEEREKAFTTFDESKKVDMNPLYKQLEYKYKDYEDSEMEKRKKQLQSLRDLH